MKLINKVPSKKISSDKRKRVVNAKKSKLSESGDRPFSKTGHISDLNLYRSNERLKYLNLLTF